MNSPFNVRSESPPSISGLKKRPAPIIRTRVKPIATQPPSIVDLDDPVPLEGKLYDALNF